MAESLTAESFFQGFEGDQVMVEIDPVNSLESGVAEQADNVGFIGREMTPHDGKMPCRRRVQKAHLLGVDDPVAYLNIYRLDAGVRIAQEVQKSLSIQVCL
jgi:hypothetical protein